MRIIYQNLSVIFGEMFTKSIFHDRGIHSGSIASMKSWIKCQISLHSILNNKAFRPEVARKMRIMFHILVLKDMMSWRDMVSQFYHFMMSC